MWRKGKTTTHLTLSQSQRKYVVLSWSLAYVVASVWQTWFVQSIDSHPYFQTKKFYSRFLDLAGLSPMKAISVGLERVCLLIWGEVEGADHPQKLDSLSNTNPPLESRFSLFLKAKAVKVKMYFGECFSLFWIVLFHLKVFLWEPISFNAIERSRKEIYWFHIVCVEKRMRKWKSNNTKSWKRKYKV